MQIKAHVKVVNQPFGEWLEQSRGKGIGDLLLRQATTGCWLAGSWLRARRSCRAAARSTCAPSRPSIIRRRSTAETGKPGAVKRWPNSRASCRSDCCHWHHQSTKLITPNSGKSQVDLPCSLRHWVQQVCIPRGATAVSSRTEGNLALVF